MWMSTLHTAEVFQRRERAEPEAALLRNLEHSTLKTSTTTSSIRSILSSSLMPTKSQNFRTSSNVFLAVNSADFIDEKELQTLRTTWYRATVEKDFFEFKNNQVFFSSLRWLAILFFLSSIFLENEKRTWRMELGELEQ